MRMMILKIAKGFLNTTYDKNLDIPCITEYYGKQKHTKIPYCVMFVWHIYHLAGADKLFYGGSKTASCSSLLSFYKKYYPQWVHKDVNRLRPGDMILFNFDSDSAPDHIGIFVGMSGDKLITYEGNTSNIVGSNSNGGWIKQKTRKMSQVHTFISPEIVGVPKCPYPVPTNTVVKGDKSLYAGWVQWQLTRHGYDCMIDKSFGGASDKMLRKFQKDNGLVVDGRCGKLTREKLKL